MNSSEPRPAKMLADKHVQHSGTRGAAEGRTYCLSHGKSAYDSESLARSRHFMIRSRSALVNGDGRAISMLLVSVSLHDLA